jgi:SOS-response transcriptional repressor LexA
MSGISRHMAVVLEYIRSYRLEHGYCPSYAEISKGVGLSSKSGVSRVIGLLEERGKIRRLPGQSRSIELIPASPVLSVELPPHIYAQVQAVARAGKVTAEAVVIEAVRDGFKAFRSKTVPHETPVPCPATREGLPRPTRHNVEGAQRPAVTGGAGR